MWERLVNYNQGVEKIYRKNWGRLFCHIVTRVLSSGNMTIGIKFEVNVKNRGNGMVSLIFYPNCNWNKGQQIQVGLLYTLIYTYKLPARSGLVRKCSTKDFDFLIVNIPFACSNMPQTPTYGLYISQLIRYFRELVVPIGISLIYSS